MDFLICEEKSHMVSNLQFLFFFKLRVRLTVCLCWLLGCRLMPEPEERFYVDPWRSVRFQRQGSFWWQGSPQRGHVCRGPLLRLPSQLQWGRGRWGPYRGLKRSRDEHGYRGPLLLLGSVLLGVHHLLHLADAWQWDSRPRSRLGRRSPLRRGTLGREGGRRWVWPREAPGARRGHRRGGDGRRQSEVGQVAVRHLREHRLPECRPWRLRGAAVSAAAVQGDGVVVEPGPQSLDVKALLLWQPTGVRKCRVQSLCFLEQEVSRRARHCPPPSPEPPHANKHAAYQTRPLPATTLCYLCNDACSSTASCGAATLVCGREAMSLWTTSGETFEKTLRLKLCSHPPNLFNKGVTQWCDFEFVP